MTEIPPKIQLTPLKRISLESGDVLHDLRKSDEAFHGFGEAYFSFIHHHAIKGWKCHKMMCMNLIVPAGDVKFVFYDQLVDQFTEVIIGDSDYQRITVQPNIWFAFQGRSESTSIVLNIANITHDPTESLKKELTDLKYVWKK